MEVYLRRNFGRVPGIYNSQFRTTKRDTRRSYRDGPTLFVQASEDSMKEQEGRSRHPINRRNMLQDSFEAISVLREVGVPESCGQHPGTQSIFIPCGDTNNASYNLLDPDDSAS